MFDCICRHYKGRCSSVIRNINLKRMDIPNIRIMKNGIITGPTFQDRPVEELRVLRSMGIRRIIDLRADAPDVYAKTCKKCGFKYYRFPFDFVDNVKDKDFYVSQKGKNKVQASEKLMKLLRKFFKIMRQGDVYAGCQYGIDRTNKALTVNYFLNAKMVNGEVPMLLHWPEETQKAVVNRNVKIVRKIFNHLSDRQKKKLQLPETFSDILKEKMTLFMNANKN